MTPKEKAKELVSKNYSIISGMELSYLSKLITFPNGDSHFETARECSIIAVDEIIIACPIESDRYWKKVKKEIERL